MQQESKTPVTAEEILDQNIDQYYKQVPPTVRMDFEMKLDCPHRRTALNAMTEYAATLQARVKELEESLDYAKKRIIEEEKEKVQALQLLEETEAKADKLEEALTVLKTGIDYACENSAEYVVTTQDIDIINSALSDYKGGEGG